MRVTILDSSEERKRETVHHIAADPGAVRAILERLGLHGEDADAFSSRCLRSVTLELVPEREESAANARPGG